MSAAACPPRALLHTHIHTRFDALHVLVYTHYVKQRMILVLELQQAPRQRLTPFVLRLLAVEFAN